MAVPRATRLKSKKDQQLDRLLLLPLGSATRLTRHYRQWKLLLLSQLTNHSLGNSHDAGSSRPHHWRARSASSAAAIAARRNPTSSMAASSCLRFAASCAGARVHSQCQSHSPLLLQQPSGDAYWVAACAGPLAAACWHGLLSVVPLSMGNMPCTPHAPTLPTRLTARAQWQLHGLCRRTLMALNAMSAA